MFSLLLLLAKCKLSGIFSNESGILTSPSYPNPYPNNAECEYIISQPNGTCVNLTVEAFDVEAIGGCSTDFLEIRDGMDPDSPLLGKFCGNTIGSDIPTSIQSTQQNLRISFRSNYIANGQGFAFKYETGICAGYQGKEYFKTLCKKTEGFN